MNKNFLNNQNYILGKTEKNKLLSKFFVEKIINLFFTFLNKISNFRFIWKYYFGIIVLGIFIIYLFSGDKFFFLLFFGSFIYGFFSFLIYNIFKDKINKQSNNVIISNKIDFKKLFIGRNFFGFNNILLYFLFLHLFSYLLTRGINEDSLNVFIIGFILFFGFSIFISYFNIFNMLVFTTFILLQPFIIMYIFMNIVLNKVIKGYKFIKFHPKTKFLEKFNIIQKNIAKNNYYKIKLK